MIAFHVTMASIRSRGYAATARILLATTAVAALVAAGWWLRSGNRRSLLTMLAESASQTGSRPVEARLSGNIAWQPYPGTAGVKSKTGTFGDMRLRSAVLFVLDSASGDESAEARHAAALAHLLIDQSDQAANILDAAASTYPDSQMWSDLAAAHYESSVRANDPAKLAKALAAADAALQTHPPLPEALFNRALILERLGLRDQAREAWKRFVVAEPASAWADEAREHIRSLPREEPFRDYLERHYERLAADPATAHALVHVRPQETRTWGETEILYRWAVAERKNDGDAAAKHLRIAREWGRELARYRGDRMLASAVSVIDGADQETKALLATGHIAFRDGQQLYRKNKAAGAHELFVEASAAFEKCRSPVGLLARYFTANTAHDIGHVTEARAQHERLLATAPPEFPAHRAQLQWQLGRSYFLDGRWGEALKTLDASVAGFDRLGETAYAAAVREILAEVYDRMGDDEGGWRERMIALRQLGHEMSMRLKIAVSSMTRLALLKGEWAQAASFLRLELELAQNGGTQAGIIEMLLLRAQLYRHVGRVEEAQIDLSAARTDIARLNDPAISSLLHANSLAIEGTLASTPAESIRLLTAAIASYSDRGRRMMLPELFLERGRAHARSGDTARAAADYETGIAELEKGRETLPAGANRLSFFHDAEELFEEALALALARGEPATAFQYSERARARQILDTLGVERPSVSKGDVPPDTAVIEYVSLPSRVVIFVLDQHGLVVEEVPADRRTLTDRVASFSHAIRAADASAMNAAGTTLHQMLIEPVAARLAANKNVVFVPDNELGSVAFAALRDRTGRYLIEDHNVVVCPSAAVHARLAKRPRSQTASPHLLILANPLIEEGPYLPLRATEIEAERIARLYADAVVLTRAEATTVAFRDAAPAATIIHFAGHAVVGKASETALLLSRAGNDSWRADVKSIAAMHLDKTELVVLAGCSTARGQAAGTEGTLSLARSFIAAGVPSVVATLEPIDDVRAAELFSRLHELLVRGLNPAEALRTVQIEAIRRPPGKGNSAWGAVQLIGR